MAAADVANDLGRVDRGVIDVGSLVDAGQEAVAPELGTDDRLAWTKHEVARMRSGPVRRTEEFHMVHFGKAVCIDGLPNSPRKIRELLHVPRVQNHPVPFHKIKPITTPGDISRHLAEARHLHRKSLFFAIAGHILNPHGAVPLKFRRHSTDARFDAMPAELQSAKMRERRHQADRSVPAHAEISHIVKENNSDSAGGIVRPH